MVIVKQVIAIISCECVRSGWVVVKSLSVFKKSCKHTGVENITRSFSFISIFRARYTTTMTTGRRGV